MAKTKVRPLADYVLIEPLDGETTTASGIVIPDSAKEKPQEGKIVEIGTSDDIKVKVGDVVMYKKWGGTEVKVDGTEMLLVKHEDLLAVVERK